METLRENYPRPAFYSCMNFLGTHDTSRALTVLSGEGMPEGREAQSRFHLSAAGRERGLTRLFLATGVLFTFPGSPMIYYGDEAGMEGCTDPLIAGRTLGVPRTGGFWKPEGSRPLRKDTGEGSFCGCSGGITCKLHRKWRNGYV